MKKLTIVTLSLIALGLTACNYNNQDNSKNNESSSQSTNLNDIKSLDDLAEVAGYEVSLLYRTSSVTSSYVDGEMVSGDEDKTSITYTAGQKENLLWGYIEPGEGYSDTTKLGYAYDSDSEKVYSYNGTVWKEYEEGEEQSAINYFEEAIEKLIPNDVYESYLKDYSYTSSSSSDIAGRECTKYSFTLSTENPEVNSSTTTAYDLYVDNQYGIFLKFIKSETILYSSEMSYINNTVSFDVTHFGVFPTTPELPE